MADNFGEFRPDWVVGTLTLTSGSKNFTATNAQLTLAAIREGDTIITPGGLTLPIESINANGNGGVLAQNAPAAAAGTYATRIRYQSDNSRFTGMLAALVARMAGGNLQSIAGLTGAADKGLMFTGAGTAGMFDLTALARTLLSRTTGAGMYGDLGEIPNAQLPGRLREWSQLIANLDEFRVTGFGYTDGSTIGKPTGINGFVQNVFWGSAWGVQIHYDGTSGNQIAWMRNWRNGTWTAWERILTATAIAATRTASSAVITLPTSAGNLIVQLATTTASTDSGGYGDFALVTTYPTAQITCVMNTGNYSASSAVIGPRTGATDLTTSRVFFRSGTPSALIHINYISIGY